TMSSGAARDSTADARWAGSRAWTSSRARSSAPASGRRGWGPSNGEDAGSAPRKIGVDALTSPSTTRWLIDTWCPPKRQDHGPSLLGSPHTRRDDRAGERPPRRSVERVLRADDRGDGEVGGGGQPRCDEAHGEALLGRPHRRQRQPAM